jgi:segregation and condensation protein A
MTIATHSIEDYRVDLDSYSGPLDLLLFLVRRNEIDLADIPIARLTEQYLEFIKLLEEVDINLTGEFLVMAATLLEIKSAMLVPKVEEPGKEGGNVATVENPLDPRYELVQQLLSYKRLKDAAALLDKRRETWEMRFARKPPMAPARPRMTLDQEYEEPAADLVVDLEDAHILDLCNAFARIMESIGQNTSHNVTYDDTPITLHADDIVDRLKRDGLSGEMTLQKIFEGRTGRGEMIGLFLATLELVRQKRLVVVQDAPGSEIRLKLRPEADQHASEDKTVDWRDPKTGEIDYEWTSPEAKKAADRRAKLRATYAAKKAAGEAVPAEEEETVPDATQDVAE